ncbi:MAG: hypothetical protein ABR609_03120 [Acidimicrobiia bacterium]|nr:hypothetical protein [Acidimicrobiia bacterium]
MAELEIKGGADEYEAAAIMAVFAQINEEAVSSRAKLPLRRRPAAWVRAYVDAHPDDPLPVVSPDQRGKPAPS